MTDCLRTPLGWLVVAAVGAALVATSVSPPMWMVFAVIVVLIVMGITWPLIAMAAVSAELRFDRKRCSEKNRLKVHLLIRNRLWLPIWGLAVEKGFFRGAVHGEDEIAIALARVQGCATSDFVWDYDPPHRGLFPLEPPQLSCGFPFGLWFSRKTVSVHQHLIVWPQISKLGSIPPLSGSHQLVSESCSDRSGNSGDRIGVRPYREGDSLRLVHWGQTARFDRLVVCDRQSPARERVMVVADAGEGTAKWREDCLRVAASICSEFHAHGYDVAFQVGRLDLRIDAREGSFRQAMDRISVEKMDSLSMASEIVPVTEKSELQFVVSSSPSFFEKFPSAVRAVLVGQSSEPGGADEEKPVRCWISVPGGNRLHASLSKEWVRGCQKVWQVSG
ncbi:MAG: DUF58 domain-containing protein [Planctomycetota bacterium]|nr:DUF58 domain-containing protein [Planctomycetota bacterium]